MTTPATLDTTKPDAPPPSSTVVESTPAAAKKRKRPSTTITKKGDSKNKPLKNAPPPPATTTPPPTQVLVLDNGGDTIKYGWNTDSAPSLMDNVTARLSQQWTVLVGDQLQSTIQNPNQLIGVTRSTERGMIVNLGNQIQVWKRILDLMGVAVPLQTEAAQAFHWKKNATSTGRPSTSFIAPATCAVLIALPPHCPRSILDAVTQIWLEDFGFGHVGFCLSAVCARHEHVKYKTSLTVDLGWSGTQILPTVSNTVLKEGIRRMPLGGRHLINIWKYYASYRQWNLMEQDWILRDIFEKAGYVSLSFKEDMQLARRLGKGRRPFDREYVLPDYQTTFVGSVRLPALLRQLEHEQDNQEEEDEDDDDSSVDQRDLMEEDIEDDGKDLEEIQLPPSAEAPQQTGDSGGDDDDMEIIDDDENETFEQARARLLKQRAAEERRRREMEQEHQVLHLSVERFAVPECLFRPSDAFLPVDMAGISQAIVQAIEACEEVYQPALYRSIYLVGGVSQLVGLKERLQQELQSLSPCQYLVSISASERPLMQAWLGACKLSREITSAWAISRSEYEAFGKRQAWKRLVDCGQLI